MHYNTYSFDYDGGSAPTSFRIWFYQYANGRDPEYISDTRLTQRGEYGRASGYYFFFRPINTSAIIDKGDISSKLNTLASLEASSVGFSGDERFLLVWNDGAEYADTIWMSQSSQLANYKWFSPLLRTTWVKDISPVGYCNRCILTL